MGGRGFVERHYCHVRRGAASVSTPFDQQDENAKQEYIFFKKQCVLA